MYLVDVLASFRPIVEQALSACPEAKKLFEADDVLGAVSVLRNSIDRLFDEADDLTGEAATEREAAAVACRKTVPVLKLYIPYGRGAADPAEKAA
jgi:hypothetical protein